MSRPSRSDVQNLIEAYARRIFSVDRAPLKSQQGLYQKFEKLRAKLAARYPGVDLDSSALYSQLQDQATAWWYSRPTNGPGVDW